MPRLPDRRFAPDCTIEVDGRPLPARRGESVAVALLAANRVVVARSAKYHRPRGAFCLSGTCHACLARIDGAPNQRTCTVPCRDGLVVETQHAVPSAEHDLLGAIDRVYAHGLDHHHLMTWSAVANRATVAISRQLAGTGNLPTRHHPATPLAVQQRFDAAVIGGGPAGLAAAEALAQHGARVLIADSGRVLGGRLRCRLGGAGDPTLRWAAEVERRISAAGGEACPATTALGIWHDGDAPLVVLRPDTASQPLRLVRARTIVVATGSCAVPPVCPRNDLPGVFAARGVARTLAEDGVVPGRRCAVAGEDVERERIVDAIRHAGARVVEIGALAEVVGGRRVRAVVADPGRRIRCDALIWCGPRAPASALAREAGAVVEFAAGVGWRLHADDGGATSVPGLRVAGEVVAAMSAAEAAAAGYRAGEAARGD